MDQRTKEMFKVAFRRLQQTMIHGSICSDRQKSRQLTFDITRTQYFFLSIYCIYRSTPASHEKHFVFAFRHPALLYTTLFRSCGRVKR